MTADGARPSLLGGPYAVATLLLAMDRADASRVLQQFDETEIRTIVSHAVNLGNVSQHHVSYLVDMLDQQLSQPPDVEGSHDRAVALIRETLPEDLAENILAALNDSPLPVEVWSRLPEADAGPMAEAILSEHPQVAAFIISHLEPEFASTIVGGADKITRHELFDRMLYADKVTDRAAKLLEFHLSQSLLGSFSENEDGNVHAHVASILNRLDRAVAGEIIDSMSMFYPREAKRIRSMMFDFADVPKLSVQSRAKLFEAVPPEKLVMALAGAESGLTAAALESLTGRARRMIEMELRSNGDAPEKDVEDARRWIADLAVGMAKDGRIELIEEDAA